MAGLHPVDIVVLVAYGTAGGLGAAIVTDFVQGLPTILFSFLLLPFVLGAVGGLDGVRRTIDDPSMMSLIVPGEIGLFFCRSPSRWASFGNRPTRLRRCTNHGASSSTRCPPRRPEWS